MQSEARTRTAVDAYRPGEAARAPNPNSGRTPAVAARILILIRGALPITLWGRQSRAQLHAALARRRQGGSSPPTDAAEETTTAVLPLGAAPRAAAEPRECRHRHVTRIRLQRTGTPHHPPLPPPQLPGQPASPSPPPGFRPPGRTGPSAAAPPAQAIPARLRARRREDAPPAPVPWPLTSLPTVARAAPAPLRQ